MTVFIVSITLNDETGLLLLEGKADFQEVKETLCSENPVFFRMNDLGKFIEKEEEWHMRIYVTENYQEMSRQAANILSAQIILKPDCVLGLATGSSPIGTYDQL